MKRLLNRSELSEMEDDVIRTACLVRIFGIEQCRNDWGRPGGGFAETWELSLEKAKRAVEPRRKRGSAWRIYEWPACALVGEQRSLILVSLSTSALASITRRPLPATIRELGDPFTLRQKNELDLLVTPTTDFPPATAPWRRYESASEGPGSLSWVPNATSEDRFELLSAVLALVQILNSRSGAQ